MDAEPTEHPAMPTYSVTDQRPPRRRIQQQKALAGDLERLAAQVIAYTTGQQVHIQDDGSQDAMPDLRIEYPGHAPGFAEVVADMDPAYTD